MSMAHMAYRTSGVTCAAGPSNGAAPARETAQGGVFSDEVVVSYPTATASQIQQLRGATWPACGGRYLLLARQVQPLLATYLPSSRGAYCLPAK